MILVAVGLVAILSGCESPSSGMNGRENSGDLEASGNAATELPLTISGFPVLPIDPFPDSALLDYETNLELVEFDIKVLSVARAGEVEGNVAKGEFVIIDLEVASREKYEEDLPLGINGSNLIDRVDRSSSGITLSDGQLRVYQPHEDASLDLARRSEALDDPFDELGPGLTYHYALVFDVPGDAEDLELLIGHPYLSPARITLYRRATPVAETGS